MIRFGLLLCGVLAASLLAVIMAELDQPAADQPTHPPATAIPVPHGATAAAQPPDQAAQWAATVLARPLFSPDRRPPPPGSAGPAASVELPRLAGILISHDRRVAIFEPPGAPPAPPSGPVAGVPRPKPVVAQEGARIGAFTLQSIDPGQVTMAGPDGPRILRPVLTPGPRPAPVIAALPAGSAARAAQPQAANQARPPQAGASQPPVALALPQPAPEPTPVPVQGDQ